MIANLMPSGMLARGTLMFIIAMAIIVKFSDKNITSGDIIPWT
jgi:hypothetical protein